METPTYYINSGNFPKGATPWNKGKKTVCRDGDYVVKGRQGFACRPVLSIAPDGTIEQRFASVGAAQKTLGVRDRHSVTNACRHRSFCRGKRLVYEDEYVASADYHWRRSKYRDINGQLLKGHHANSLMHYTEEGKARQRERAHITSLRMAHDPNNRWGKALSSMKPVECVDTGEHFPSIKACAQHFEIPPNQISSAITRHGRVRGLAFRKL